MVSSAPTKLFCGRVAYNLHRVYLRALFRPVRCGAALERAGAEVRRCGGAEKGLGRCGVRSFSRVGRPLRRQYISPGRTLGAAAIVVLTSIGPSKATPTV